MIERTRESQQNGDKHMPLTLVMINDLMANARTGGYLYNNDLLMLMSTSHHSGYLVVANTQSCNNWRTQHVFKPPTSGSGAFLSTSMLETTW